MAVIYLEHPKHGKKVACSEDEAKFDEKNGWSRFQVAALLKPAANSDLVHRGPVAESKPIPNATGEVSINALREQYMAKFGEKPHHKKSAETLRRELQEA